MLFHQVIVVTAQNDFPKITNYPVLIYVAKNVPVEPASSSSTDDNVTLILKSGRVVNVLCDDTILKP